MKYRNKHSETIDPREVDIFIVNVLERDAHFTSFLHFSRLTTDEIVLKIIYKNYHEKLPLIKKHWEISKNILNQKMVMSSR